MQFAPVKPVAQQQRALPSSGSNLQLPPFAHETPAHALSIYIYIHIMKSVKRIYFQLKRICVDFSLFIDICLVM